MHKEDTNKAISERETISYDDKDVKKTYRFSSKAGSAQDDEYIQVDELKMPDGTTYRGTMKRCNEGV